jgi:hypothetical protein
LLAFLFCVPMTNVRAQRLNWYQSLRNIVPLRSTRSDVEKLFSAPKKREEFANDGVRAVYYENYEGKFTVEYSLGTCAAINEKRYSADRDVVLTIIYFPKNQPPFSKFKLDNGAFAKTKQGDDPDWHYISTALGFDYGVQLNRVDFIERFPSARSPTSDCK